MKTMYHLSLDARHALTTWDNKQFQGMFKHPFGKPMTTQEAKSLLLDELLRGHEKIPVGECDNFDWKSGCQGHKTEEDE
jgi:hypothetical protein